MKSSRRVFCLSFNEIWWWEERTQVVSYCWVFSHEMISSLKLEIHSIIKMILEARNDVKCSTQLNFFHLFLASYPRSKHRAKPKNLANRDVRAGWSGLKVKCEIEVKTKTIVSLTKPWILWVNKLNVCLKQTKLEMRKVVICLHFLKF